AAALLAARQWRSGLRAAASALTGNRLGLAACPDHYSTVSAALAVSLSVKGVRARLHDPSSEGTWAPASLDRGNRGREDGTTLTERPRSSGGWPRRRPTGPLGLRAPVGPRPLPQWPREPARQFEAGALTSPVPRQVNQWCIHLVTFGRLEEAGARSWRDQATSRSLRTFPSASRRASTQTGSNWSPDRACSSSRAASRLRDGRYARDSRMATNASAVATMRAPSGVDGPSRPSGYPPPSQRSWCQRTMPRTVAWATVGASSA